MTKQIFADNSLNRSVLGADGAPTHSVIGTAANFYVYVSHEHTPWSGRFKGSPDRYSALKRLHAGRDQAGFIALVERMFKEAPPDGSV